MNQPKQKQYKLDKGFNIFIKGWLVLTFIILFAPIVTITVMSFNSSEYGTFPFHFTFEWYQLLFTKSDLFTATKLSLSLAFWVALSAIIIGTLAAVGAKSLPGKVRNVFLSAMSLPVIIPWLVTGISILMIFNYIGIGRSYLGLYLGNLIVVLPYVFLLVYGSFSEMDHTPEEAARMLGAKPYRVFFEITVPIISPSIMSGGLMAFMVCFNNFVIQYFLAPFGVRTLPLEIFTLIRVGFKPDINALAAIMIVFSIVIVLLLNKFNFSTRKLF